jgi:hypothetical protein
VSSERERKKSKLSPARKLAACLSRVDSLIKSQLRLFSLLSLLLVDFTLLTSKLLFTLGQTFPEHKPSSVRAERKRKMPCLSSESHTALGDDGDKAQNAPNRATSFAQFSGKIAAFAVFHFALMKRRASFLVERCFSEKSVWPKIPMLYARARATHHSGHRQKLNL